MFQNAVVRGTLLGLQYMGKDKGGRGGVIVNTASVLGLEPIAACPIYCASKSFVVGLCRSLAKPWHWNRTGVKVICLCPGITDTLLVAEAGQAALTTLGSDVGQELVRELGALPAQQ